MKIHTKNLGPLKIADISLGDFNIICGDNNTGKSFLSHTLYKFLVDWKKRTTVFAKQSTINRLLDNHVIRMSIKEYIENASNQFKQSCRDSIKEKNKNSEFEIDIMDYSESSYQDEYVRYLIIDGKELVSFFKGAYSDSIVIRFLVERGEIEIPIVLDSTYNKLGEMIDSVVKDLILGSIFPKVYISSGDSITQTSVDVNKSSYLSTSVPDVLDDFANIIGGEYLVTNKDEIYYIPSKSKRVKIPLNECSSSVRSLLDIGLYLKHVAQRGDLLILEEPERYLHPENQRRIARLFARLVNLGIKVFITTHSDYIVKELNSLIMLNHDEPHLKQIAKEEGYRQEELMDSKRFRVYIAEEAPVKLNDSSRKTKVQTLVAANIDPKRGIEVRCFDATIDAMDRVQNSIIWGNEYF